MCRKLPCPTLVWRRHNLSTNVWSFPAPDHTKGNPDYVAILLLSVCPPSGSWIGQATTQKTCICSQPSLSKWCPSWMREKEPRNWMSYADLAVYVPSTIQFQMILSGLLGFKVTCEIIDQRLMNSVICCSVEMVCSDLIQVPSVISCHTDLCFRLVREKSDGAVSFEAFPCNCMRGVN